MTRTVLRTGACFALCAIALGAGCWKATSDERPSGFGFSAATTSTGPKVLDAKGRDPKDLADTIKIVQSSVIVLQQDVSAPSPALLTDLTVGMGENHRTVVIKRFAPGNLAELEWKSEFFTPGVTEGKPSTTTRQFTGSMTEAQLLDSYKLYPPAMWHEGDMPAFGSGILWLSQDVYENLSRGNKMSSFYFGLTDSDFVRTLGLKSGSSFAAAVQRLKAAGDDAINNKHTDIYLAKTQPEDVEWDMTVNGIKTKVAAIKVTSWFGSFLVLKNPYYPLVLQVKMDKPVHDLFGTLFDYDVTELKDVQQ